MPIRFWPLLLYSVAACAPAEIQDRTAANLLSYSCSDLVVIGRVTTRSGETVTKPDDMLGRGRWQMDVQIKHILRGTEQRGTVPATAVAHAPPRSDRDFLAVLSPIDGGRYHLKTATLWDVRPQPSLIEPCS